MHALRVQFDIEFSMKQHISHVGLIAQSPIYHPHHQRWICQHETTVELALVTTASYFDFGITALVRLPASTIAPFQLLPTDNVFAGLTSDVWAGIHTKSTLLVSLAVHEVPNKWWAANCSTVHVMDRKHLPSWAKAPASKTEVSLELCAALQLD